MLRHSAESNRGHVSSKCTTPGSMDQAGKGRSIVTVCIHNVVATRKARHTADQREKTSRASAKQSRNTFLLWRTFWGRTLATVVLHGCKTECQWWWEEGVYIRYAGLQQIRRLTAATQAYSRPQAYSRYAGLQQIYAGLQQIYAGLQQIRRLTADTQAYSRYTRLQQIHKLTADA